MELSEIKQKTLKQIYPTEEFREKLEKTIKEISYRIKEIINFEKIPAEILLVGSTAKDTYLINNMDVDFFLCFPQSFNKEKIAKWAIFIGKKILSNTEESYAEHPYLRGFFNDFKVEIVPCYKISDISQKLSAVDRTPLHTKYIIDNISEEQKNEVRLFKQFLKGIGIYGAEAEIEGFSGYLCELIIIKYGSFEETLKNVSNWKKGVYISINDEKHQNFDTPLVFIDPVDKTRNVASALSVDNFNLFMYACVSFLKKPDVRFFFPNPIKPWSNDKINQLLNNKSERYIGIRFKKPDIIPENLFPQIRKSIKSIVDICERNDFKISDSVFHVSDDNVYIILKSDNFLLPKTKTHIGPPSKLKSNVNNFLKKWSNNKKVVKRPYIKGNRYFVEITRDYLDIKNFVSNNISNFNFGKHIQPVLKNSFKILENDELNIEELAIFWTDYFDGKHPWER